MVSLRMVALAAFIIGSITAAAVAAMILGSEPDPVQSARLNPAGGADSEGSGVGAAGSPTEAAGDPASTGEAASQPVRGGVLLVIAPAGLPASMLPEFRSVDGRTIRTRLVSSMAAATAIDPAELAAIAVERGSIEAVDWLWIQEQFKSGKSVAGLNIGMGELLDRLYPASKDLSGNDGLGWVREAPDEDWTAGHLFYSVLAGQPCKGGRTNVYDEGAERDFVTALIDKSCGPTGLAFE